jgi:hypothetical protein
MFRRKTLTSFSRFEWPKEKLEASDTGSYPRKPEPTEKYLWMMPIFLRLLVLLKMVTTFRKQMSTILICKVHILGKFIVM